MKDRRLIRLAWLVAGVAFLFLLINLSLYGLCQSCVQVSNIIGGLGMITAPVVGGLIASRHPRNAYGWIWLLLGFGTNLQFFAQNYVYFGLVAAPGSLPFARYVYGFAPTGWILSFTMISFAFLLFPTGHLPSRRWRYPAWIIAISAFIGVLIGWGVPGPSGFVGTIGPSGYVPIENPIGLQGIVGEIIGIVVFIVIFPVLSGILLGVVSLLLHFRNSNGAKRLQMKWFVFGAFLFGLYFLSDFVYELPGIWENLKEAIFFNLLPVMIGIAILRHRLLDIDLIIRRTLLYGGMSITLGGVYFGSVLLLQSLFRDLFGGANQFAVVVSTLLIAALFNPLRRRIQTDIDRRFYRRRYDAERTLQAFTSTLRDETSLEQVSAHLVSVVRETMQPEHLSLWLRLADDKSARERTDS